MRGGACVRVVVALVSIAAISIAARADDLASTREHPFWVTNRDHDGDGLLGEWVPARSLQAGDRFVLADGSEAVLHATEPTHRQVESDNADPNLEPSTFSLQPVTTYNFEVAQTHTYFVGRCGVWVHNKCEPAWLEHQRAHKPWRRRDATANFIRDLCKKLRGQNPFTPYLDTHSTFRKQFQKKLRANGSPIAKWLDQQLGSGRVRFDLMDPTKNFHKGANAYFSELGPPLREHLAGYIHLKVAHINRHGKLVRRTMDDMIETLVHEGGHARHYFDSPIEYKTAPSQFAETVAERAVREYRRHSGIYNRSVEFDSLIRNSDRFDILAEQGLDKLLKAIQDPSILDN